MPKVLISDSLSPQAIAVFKEAGIDVDVKIDLSESDLIAIIGEYDGIAIRSATKLNAKVLAAATKLKVIGRAGIGVDNIDLPAATAQKIQVMNTPFGNSTATAEHAITLLMATARQLGSANSTTHAGKWLKNKYMGVEVTGKTLGVIGCGNIRSIVAERAQGLKMKVIAYDPGLDLERARGLGVDKVELDELLRDADFITLHTPMTPQTKYILNKDTLAKTKPGVRIVNCARGRTHPRRRPQSRNRIRSRSRCRSRRARSRARQREPALRHGTNHRDPASGRFHLRSPRKRRPSGSRANRRLPQDRRSRKRSQQTLKPAKWRSE